MQPSKQAGVALVTVMLVLALCVVLASRMSSNLIYQVQRSENLYSNQQAYWYAMGAEAFAKTVLAQSFKSSNDKEVTHLAQPWAAGETAFPVDLGEISGEIKDLQSCFNLNSLLNKQQGNNDNTLPAEAGDNNNSDNEAEPQASQDNHPITPIENKAKASLIELITLLEVDGVDRFSAEYMAEALLDWLDEDSSIVSAGGAEDNDYAAREYPYLAANNKLVSVNELRLIEHFTPQVIMALQDYVCVIPDSDIHRININTIDNDNVLLLQALLGGVDEGTAEEILSKRGDKGFKTINEFYDLSVVKNIKNQQQWRQQFVVDSDYFELTTKTSFNNSYFSMRSVMKINEDDTITVVDRTIGVN
ncbi:type II secretion system minor pseudopilin GspK [Thalassotalea maritima]|uniref:type II secretion system minor pseudopilin GspK n=1 Tax=Thalassotalea maritima TaxID=3242416 RepID=UPI003528F5B8